MLTLSLRIVGWTLLDIAILVPPEPTETDCAATDVGIAAVIEVDDGEVRSAREDRLGFVASSRR